VRDAHQIERDVARALWRYPAGIRMPQRLALRKRLAALIHAVLGHHPELQCVARGARRRRRHARSLACGGSYYQGFHDVCAVVMLNLDDTSAFVVASQLALVHLRDYMRPDMTTTLAYLELLAALLAQVEPEIHDLMERSAVGGHFALSWLLTRFCARVRGPARPLPHSGCRPRLAAAVPALHGCRAGPRAPRPGPRRGVRV
jgi:hypothetical protein